MQLRAILIGALSALVILLPIAPASAQDVAAAAQAFEQGQAAQLRGDHGEAARFFELADRLAPSPAALRSAIRNYAAASNRARAATLAADALSRYPGDADVRSVADDALSVSEELGTLVVRCDAPCTVVVDGSAIETEAALERSLFVEPGPRHVVATFADAGRAEGGGDVAAGETLEVALEAPVVEADSGSDDDDDVGGDPSPATEAGDDPSTADTGTGTGTGESADADAGGLPLWVPLAALGATAVAGALTIWSGVDTLSARDAYVEMPTEAGYEDGVGLQTRTNVLIGVTVGLAAVTAVLFVFADMRREEEERLSASVAAGPEGGAVVVTGAF